MSNLDPRDIGNVIAEAFNRYSGQRHEPGPECWRVPVEGGEVVLPPGMTEADLLRSVLRQVLVEGSPTADGGDEGV